MKKHECEGIINLERCCSGSANEVIVIGELTKCRCFLCNKCATEFKEIGYKVVEIMDETSSICGMDYET